MDGLNPRPSPHPFQKDRRSPLLRAITPTSVGSLTAAALAFYPKVSDGFKIPDAILRLPGSSVLNKVPSKAYVALVGFLLGYSTTHSLSWMKWGLLKSLLTYQGWVTAPKSAKTKMWALMVRLLSGPGPHSTFEFQAIMPKQPLPDLGETLDRWLSVNKQLLSPEDFELTKEAVEEFRVNEGPKIQAFLREKARKQDSFIADYWVNLAYLASREALMINNNYYVTNRLNPNDLLTSNQIERAASTIWLHLDFSRSLQDDIVKPVTLNDIVPLCMDGYRYIFNTVRVPGEHIDSIQRYPSAKHIVIIRKGHFFKVNVYAPTKGNSRHMSLITPQELKAQLAKIVQIADALPEEEPVAALTSQKRSIWAKQREILQKKNEQVLHDVESSMFICTLDDKIIKDHSEQAKRIFVGAGNDRWFDKCFNSCINQNGERMGINVEHTVIDAMVFSTLTEHFSTLEPGLYENGELKQEKGPLRDLGKPERLQWNTEDLTDEIQTAIDAFHVTTSQLDLHTMNPPYGKGFMKKCRVSPDGFIQMAMQLAYYRMHKETPKTYEPSTSRLFMLGRTETVHPCSAHSVAWVKSMDDPSSMPQSRQELLKKAVKHQGQFRLDATVGKGCDRHLLGLFCASRELGMDIPKLFMDKAWRAPFKLSTSQTPTKLWDYGAKLKYTECTGGFGPNCEDGYGISYIIYGDDILNFAITSWKSCADTDSVKFAQQLTQAFEDMKALFAS